MPETTTSPPIPMSETLHRHATELGREMGMPLDRLMIEALERFVSTHRPEYITDSFNALHERDLDPVDPALRAVAHERLRRIEW